MDNTNREPRNHAQTASGWDLWLGVWLLLSGYAVVSNDPLVTNNLICGFVIAALSLFRFSGAFDAGWISWLTVPVGIWVAVSPWAIQSMTESSPTMGMMINNVIVGLAVVAFSIWSAQATHYQHVAQRQHEAHGPSFGM